MVCVSHRYSSRLKIMNLSQSTDLLDVIFILYAGGGNEPKRKEEAYQRGAYESISRPPNLYKVILDLFSK